MNRKSVFYILPLIDRIGEVASQLFVLRNLYPLDRHDVHIITYPFASKPQANLAVFRIASRGMSVHFTEDEGILWQCYGDQRKNRIRTEEGGEKTYVLLSCSQLRFHFYREFTGREPVSYFSLNEEEIEEGNSICDEFGIPRDAPLVTLHIRDGAVFGPPGEDSFRNADINQYLAAVDFLLERGFHVVRLGDKSMPPLKKKHPHLHDAPHHPAYRDLVDPYFIARSRFFLGSSSGPLDIAHGFNIPALVPDTPIQSTIWGYARDLFLFKKYYSVPLGRALHYGEVLFTPVLNFFRSRLFRESGIHLIDNTPEEILAATKEMVMRLEGVYPHTAQSDAVGRYLRRMESQADLVRQHTVADDIYPYMPLYALHRCAAKISYEYIRMNRWFLGHPWPEVKKWGFEPELEGPGPAESNVTPPGGVLCSS